MKIPRTSFAHTTMFVLHFHSWICLLTVISSPMATLYEMVTLACALLLQTQARVWPGRMITSKRWNVAMKLEPLSLRPRVRRPGVNHSARRRELIRWGEGCVPSFTSVLYYFLITQLFRADKLTSPCRPETTFIMYSDLPSPTFYHPWQTVTTFIVLFRSGRLPLLILVHFSLPQSLYRSLVQMRMRLAVNNVMRGL
jgi:hypothetical protein